MDYVNFSPVNTDPAKFEAPVGASNSTPKTLYHAHTDITYVSTGGAWAPMSQEASGSVYPAYTALPATVKDAVVTALSTPLVTQPVKSVKTATVLVRGH